MVYTREFSRAREMVYKVGRTGDIGGRLMGYPKGSQLLLFRQCAVSDTELSEVETEVLRELRLDPRFRACLDFGREYFERRSRDASFAGLKGMSRSSWGP